MPKHTNSISPLVSKKLKELNQSADDVLRKALNIKAEGLLTSEGVFFPEGTNFLSFYKDGLYTATLRDGLIVMDKTGKGYPSVSSAAASITGRTTTNGWSFWMVKFPGKNEVVHIQTLREK